MKNINFSKFWWGSAASGPQTEGRISGDGKGENILIIGTKRTAKVLWSSRTWKTSQVYTKYQEDVQLMKQTGHNSFRTSIQWSRLIPDESGTINEEAVRFYHRYFDELIENGIEPLWICIISICRCICKKRRMVEPRNGWSLWKYAKSCFELFGSKVKMVYS